MTKRRSRRSLPTSCPPDLRQSSLAETLELLRKDGRESLSDLADILRRAVLETGGVSVDRFVERLTEDRARAFARWDVAARGPEKSRGSEKRWRDGGKVHAAWWAMEDIRAAWMKTLAYEAALDDGRAIFPEENGNGVRLNGAE